MTNEQMLCDPCWKGNLKKDAVIYCQDCNESLCKLCEDYHGRSKIGITHKLRDLGSGRRQQDIKYLEQLKACSCRDDNKEFVEFFCEDHGVFCCGKCIISKHRKCNHVDNIEDHVAKGGDKKFDSSLGILETKIKELTDLATENAQLAKDSFIDVEKRLDEIKYAIDEAFNGLKTKVLRDAISRKQVLMNLTQQQNQNIEHLSMELNKQKANANTVNKYGTDIDKNIFSHSMETSSLKEMRSTESRFKSSLLPRQFTTKEKHSVDDIVKKLEDAIEVIDKELIRSRDTGDVHSAKSGKKGLKRVIERPEEAALPPAKHRRVVVKEECSTIQEVKESIECISYQSGINHEENPDEDRVPDAVPRGQFNQVNVQGEATIIVFTLRTTGLIQGDIMPHITQIAATNMETGDNFNQYIRPGLPITAKAQRITGIALNGSVMTVNGIKVESLDILDALEQFCSWLSRFHNVCLVAHDGREIDFPVLMNALVSNGQKYHFHTSVIACCDTSAVFKILFPNQSRKLENLVKDILGETYDTQNAMAEVETLAKLIQPKKAIVIGNTFSPEAVYNNLLFNKQKKLNFKSLEVLVDRNICTRATAVNIAGSGLNIRHLKSIYTRSGEDGLREVFTEINREGQPRVTKMKKVLNEVIPKLGEFFSSMNVGGYLSM